MKKELNIVGLDCGHCALTLEKYLQKINGVNYCNVNFSMSKVFLEIEDLKSKEILKEIYKTAKNVNPDVKLTENVNTGNTTNIYDIILYVIGIMLGVLVMVFKFITPVFYTILICSLILMGYRTYLKALLQLRNFKINENTLITISVIGACALGETIECMMVIALYTLGKFLESKAVNFSRHSISKLISSQPEYAILISDDKEKKVKPEVVKVGDLIIVKPGEKVALDGVIESGSASIDKRHLTGESVPVQVSVGDEILSGSIVLDSTITIRVTTLYKNSAVSKIMNLVSTATNNKSKTETFISKFSSYYTLGVIALAIIVAGITFVITTSWDTAIYRGLIFLVVSCPCAFAISVPLSYFSGIGRCSKDGILVKGSNYLDICSQLNTIVFDKTGTLTTGKMQVVDIKVSKDYKKEEILEIIVAGEKNSIHPVAKAICDYYGKATDLKITNYKEIAGKGIEYKIDKDKYFVGKTNSELGYTLVQVTKNEEIIGTLKLEDQVKDLAKDCIKEIKSHNIKTMMLTGDNAKVAKTVADTIGIDEYKFDLLPDQKFEIIKDIKKDKKVAFVGDGLNDAPALTLSDVGISMGIMGSPATIESSDVVIADDNLTKIPSLIHISKETKKIVLQNIIFAGATKLTFLLLGALGITGMALAVFADVGVTLIAILNSLRVLKIKNK